MCVCIYNLVHLGPLLRFQRIGYIREKFKLESVDWSKYSSEYKVIKPISRLKIVPQTNNTSRLDITLSSFTRKLDNTWGYLSKKYCKNEFLVTDSWKSNTR